MRRFRCWCAAPMIIVSLFVVLLSTKAFCASGQAAIAVKAIHSEFAFLLDAHPHLAHGGGLIHRGADKKLIAVAVGRGVSPLDGVKGEEQSWLLAEMDALDRMGEQTSSPGYSTAQELRTRGNSGGGDSSLHWSREHRRTVDTTLRRTLEAGRWRDENGIYHVMLVIFEAGRPVARKAELFPVSKTAFKSNWEELFLACPALRHGGVAMAPDGGGVLLVAGRAPLTNGIETQSLLRASKIADMDAAARFVAYCEGVRLLSDSQYLIRTSLLVDESGERFSSIIESIRTASSAYVAGFSREMERVGEWVSEDESHLLRAYIWQPATGLVE